MRIHVDSEGMPLVPNLLGEIAERLEMLYAPYEDILEARVTLRQAGSHQTPLYKMRVELLLVGRTLCVTHEATTPQDATSAALDDIACQLQSFRLLRPIRGAMGLRFRQRLTSDAAHRHWPGHEDGGSAQRDVRC